MEENITPIPLSVLVTIILAVLGWMTTLTRYMFKQHHKVEITAQSHKSLQEWVTAFQKNNTEKHEEFMKTANENKENVQLKMELMKKDLENKMLSDKQESNAQLQKFSDKMDTFGNQMAKISTSNEHIYNMLNQMADRQTQQDKLNLEMYKELAKRN